MKYQEDSAPIAQMSEVEVCERRLYLMLRHGERTSAEREARLKEGTAAHSLTERQRRPDKAPDKGTDKRCFIATSVFGKDARETQRLREFRDSKLVVNRVGRIAVRLYYELSPPIAAMCDRSERLRSVARVAVRLLMRIAKV